MSLDKQGNHCQATDWRDSLQTLKSKRLPSHTGGFFFFVFVFPAVAQIMLCLRKRERFDSQAKNCRQNGSKCCLLCNMLQCAVKIFLTTNAIINVHFTPNLICFPFFFSLKESEVACVCFTIRCLYLGANSLVLSQSLNLGCPSPLLMDFVVFFIVSECQPCYFWQWSSCGPQWDWQDDKL